MRGRFAPLRPPALLFLILTMLLSVGKAQAHRLNAQAFLLPNKQVQIEGWFSTGEPAKGAKVEIRRETNESLASGRLDDQGVFIFSYAEAEPLTIVVAAGGGHRAQLSISAQELAQAGRSSETRGQASLSKEGDPPGPIRLAAHDSDTPIRDILIGASFLLAVAAFALSMRNARKLREGKSRT